ncbi:MAG: GNAT family N-acetyltransferase [Bdellovibrionota bacterium]
MGAPGSRWNALFENHLVFLSAHRGTVFRINDLIKVDSEKKEFSCLIPGEKAPAPEILRNTSTLQLTPWSHRPEGGYPGFSEKDGITYMRLAADLPAPAPIPGFEITMVNDKANMYAFSDIQCRAFLHDSEIYEDWAPFLHSSNEKNVGQPGQFFYLGLLDGKPVAAGMALDAEEITGMYAVATIKEVRQKGLARAIIARMVADAIARGSKDITLQVAKNSPNQAFTEKLGFRVEFTSTLMQRDPVKS